MSGVKTGGIVFVTPAKDSAVALGTGAGIMGGNYIFPKNVTTVTCDESVWDIDGLLYKEAGKWLDQCKAFYGT